MSDFVSLNTALSALRAARLRMDTASDNVANAATASFTRRRVELAPSPSYRSPEGPIGSGVDVIAVSRARDAFADARVRADASAVGDATVRAGLLARAETALGEPDAGVAEPLASLFAAFEDLALDPANPGARAAVLGALEELAARFRSIDASFDALAADAAAHVPILVARVGEIAGEIAEINRTLVAGGALDNALLDRRDALVDELAHIAGATAVVNPDGSVRVSLGGLTLVDGAQTSSLSVLPDGSLVHATGAPVEAGGELDGYRRFLTADLPSYRAALDALASDVANALNAQHQAGWVDGMQGGGALLSFTAGRAAQTLSVAIADPAQLAVSDDPGPPFPAGNARNAAALASLRTTLVAAGGTQTPEGAARALAAALGAGVRTARGLAAAGQERLAAAELARGAVHGVSLDEEMAALVEAQHAFGAAARVMTTVDQMLDVLVNRMGIVGR